MPCYEVKWREIYEMSAMVVAPSLEAALSAGANLMANTPSLDFFEEWQGDEAVTHTEVDSVKVEAELVDKLGFGCLPAGCSDSLDDGKPEEPQKKDE
jgi:hypothetical protein